MSKYKIPVWIEEGPMDLEYKTLKMMARVKHLRLNLLSGLQEVLLEVDDTLDYLYRYDAIKQTDNDLVPSIEFMGFPMDDLELVFTTEEEMDTNDIVDSMYEDCIDKFETLHSACREEWRSIESELTCSYLGNKKHFLSGGFVFISTPDNKLHVYFFNKPSKSFKLSWKDFKMEHIATKEYDEVEYFKTLEELGSAKSDRILIKANLKTHTNIHGHAITVVNSVIFNMLHRDYAF